MCSEQNLHKFLPFHGFPGSIDELNIAVNWLNEMDIFVSIDLVGADLSKEAKPGEGCSHEVHEFIVNLATVICLYALLASCMLLQLVVRK